MQIQLTHLHSEIDRLQQKYGSPGLDSIYGAGCIKNPAVCFVFMNPTGRNIAANQQWSGLKAPWLGTKNAWKLFHDIGVLSEETFADIQNKKPNDWDYDFADQVYHEITANHIYITNLGKCTKADASPVADNVFKQYLGLLEQEIAQIHPQKIITFGNQVSSLFLGEAVKVSQLRKKSMQKIINGHSYDVFPVFYPVGQGMRNLPTAIEDIRFIIENL